MLIFTDLDGTLLNHDDYRFDAALPLLKQLKDQSIPVIPVTSKTRLEVEFLRQQVAPYDPFIVENGSGVFVATQDERFSCDNCATWGEFRLMRLGCSYLQARQGLEAIAQRLGTSLQGFADLSDQDIANLTGLSMEDVGKAKAREFSEPFLTPKHYSADELENAAQAEGFNIVVGDRFSHLIGKQAGKGHAVRSLLAAYRAKHPDKEIITIGLGNSPNDRPMLETVDIPIIVPGKQGPHPGLASYGWQVAPAPGAAGWAEAMQVLCDRLLG